jgi:hypothetical protein
MSGASDRPALDLAFALDKVLTARRGPTPTFTRASTGTFVNSSGLIQSAAINVPRFDHDPLTLTCKGLLIETTRSNLLRWSNPDVDNSAGVWGYSAGGQVIRMGTTFAPDGVSAAPIYQHQFTSFAYVGQSVTLTAGVAYTYSCWAKRTAGVSTTGNLLAVYSGSTGSIVLPVVGSGVSGDWQRFSFSFTPVVTDSFLILLGSDQGNGSDFAYWGAQVEAGAFPSSHIPTTSATATRSADVCSISNYGFNPNGGTIAIEFDTAATGDFCPVHLGSPSNGTPHIQRSGSFYAANFGRAGSVINNSAASYPGSAKAAYGYKAGNSAFSVNGVLVSNSDPNAFFNNGLALIGSSGAAYLNGRISRLRYYRTRLPNSALQALTL